MLFISPLFASTDHTWNTFSIVDVMMKYIEYISETQSRNISQGSIKPCSGPCQT